MLQRFPNCPVVLVLVLLKINAYASNQDSIELRISSIKPQVETAKDLTGDIQLKSNKIEPLLFYKDPPHGFIERHLGALRIQLQRKVGEAYVDVPVHGAIDDLPTETDTIHTGNVRTYRFSIALLYHHLVPGAYRFRFLAAFSLENPKVKDKYSDWAYFRCEKEIY